MSEDNENRKKYTRKIDEYYKNALNQISELEQQNKELREDLKYIAEQCDYKFIDDILKKHNINI